MQLFYPSHDIALANGLKHFNPPAAAIHLQDDLAWLSEIFGPQPWGWSYDMRQFLHETQHLKLSELPSDADLELLRKLSSRSTTHHIISQLSYTNLLPTLIAEANQLDEFINKHDASNTPFVLKTPWSSSGRGLIRSTVTPRNLMRQRALATLRKMGCIVGEQWQNKIQDFAMLFDVEHHDVRFLGYSLFENDESGTYRQGFLLSNEAIEQRLVALGANHEELHSIQNQLITVLRELFSPLLGKPWKVGYIGIDMMLYGNSKQTEVMIHPCVEMNVRCTMGTVCRLWADKHLQPAEEGRFCISPMGDDGHFKAEFVKLP